MEQTVVVNKDTLAMVEAIAKKAGEAIMAVYEKEDFGIETKSDNSPLTAADLAAHQVIETALLEAFPGTPVLSEESADVSYEQRKDWRCFWMVDPLDGTKEFIKRNGEFTVNIALIVDQKPVLGVVYAPVLKTNYGGYLGGGAWVTDAQGEQRAVSAASYAGGTLSVVASRSHVSDELKTFLDKIDDKALINMGSSLKICLVATGEADLYPRLGPTMEWDTAAAHAVVIAAGGNLTNLQGEALSYNKENLLNPFFMVAGEPSFPWRDLV